MPIAGQISHGEGVADRRGLERGHAHTANHRLHYVIQRVQHLAVGRKDQHRNHDLAGFQRIKTGIHLAAVTVAVIVLAGISKELVAETVRVVAGKRVLEIGHGQDHALPRVLEVGVGVAAGGLRRVHGNDPEILLLFQQHEAAVSGALIGPAFRDGEGDVAHGLHLRESGRSDDQ